MMIEPGYRSEDTLDRTVISAGFRWVVEDGGNR